MDERALAEIAISLQPWVVFWALASARLFGFTMAFPLFTFVNLPLSVRFAFSAALRPPIIAVAGPTPDGVGAVSAMDTTMLAVLVGKEVAVGMALGVVAGLPLWAAMGAGELIDTYRGSSAGALFDHTLSTEASEVGIAFILVAMALLVWSGGVAAMVAALYGTFLFWPMLELFPALDPIMVESVGRLVTQLLSDALAIGGLMLLTLFAIDLAFSLSARSTRQIQVFELTLNMKNLAFAILMPFLAVPMARLIGETIYSSSELLEAFGGGP